MANPFDSDHRLTGGAKGEIAEFIAEVRKLVAGMVPDDYLLHSLSESIFWLEGLTKDLTRQGLDEQEATHEALRQSDPPKLLANAIIEDYFESGANTPLTSHIGRGNSLVLAIVGMANALYLVVLQLSLMFPTTSALSLSAVKLRKYLPYPLPLPEPTWQFLLVAGYPLIAPLLLGLWVGYLIPVRAASAVFWSTLPIIITSFLVGAFLLPNKIGILYGIVQTVYSLPMSSLLAHLSSSHLRRKRRQSAP